MTCSPNTSLSETPINTSVSSKKSEVVRSFFCFLQKFGCTSFGGWISIGFLLVAEAGLALGPLGRFQNEMEKELRPGAGEGSCYRYEESPIVIGLL